METDATKRDLQHSIPRFKIAGIVGAVFVIASGAVLGWTDKGFWGALRLGAIIGLPLVLGWKYLLHRQFDHFVERGVAEVREGKSGTKEWYHNILPFAHSVVMKAVFERIDLPWVPAVGIVLVMMLALHPEHQMISEAVRRRATELGTLPPPQPDEDEEDQSLDD